MSLLVVISSPSGGGKDTVINELLKKFTNSARLITTTSRDPRPGNKDGVDYFFVSREEFEKKIKAEGLVEYNNYAGNYYGIEKTRLAEALEKNDIVFTQIEVNGKHHLTEQGIKHLAIFLLPENLEVLAERIRRRKGVSEDKIKERLEIARREIDSSADYDYRIVNRDGRFEETVSKISEIIAQNLLGK